MSPDDKLLVWLHGELKTPPFWASARLEEIAFVGMTMKQRKKRLLESRGWKVGNPQEFLELTDEECAYIEVKLLLAENLRELRQSRDVSQTQLAKLLGSSQSRVAKMEAGDPSVSADLLLKGLLVLGATRREIGKLLGTSRNAA